MHFVVVADLLTYTRCYKRTGGQPSKRRRLGWRKGSLYDLTAQPECTSLHVTLACSGRYSGALKTALACQTVGSSDSLRQLAMWPGRGIPPPGDGASIHSASRTATRIARGAGCVRRGSHGHGGNCVAAVGLGSGPRLWQMCFGTSICGG